MSIFFVEQNRLIYNICKRAYRISDYNVNNKSMCSHCVTKLKGDCCGAEAVAIHRGGPGTSPGSTLGKLLHN